MYHILGPYWDGAVGCVLLFEKKKKLKSFEGQKETHEGGLLMSVLGTGTLPVHQLKQVAQLHASGAEAALAHGGSMWKELLNSNPRSIVKETELMWKTTAWTKVQLSVALNPFFFS